MSRQLGILFIYSLGGRKSQKTIRDNETSTGLATPDVGMIHIGWVYHPLRYFMHQQKSSNIRIGVVWAAITKQRVVTSIQGLWTEV